MINELLAIFIILQITLIAILIVILLAISELACDLNDVLSKKEASHTADNYLWMAREEEQTLQDWPESKKEGVEI